MQGPKINVGSILVNRSSENRGELSEVANEVTRIYNALAIVTISKNVAAIKSCNDSGRKMREMLCPETDWHR